jgi:uracil-DNA glycosylase
MDDPTKARVRLYLRSEKARGLNAVPARKRSDARPFLEAEAPAEPQPPQTQAAAQSSPRPAPRAAEPKALFPGAAPEVKAPGFAPIPLDEPFSAPLLPTDQKRHHLTAMNEKEVRLCTRCRLCETRTHTVFGEGDVDAKIFFIGEGPGETEDRTGRPFVGRAGELLNKMIAGMGLAREQVYIANIVKCRPPNNRVPAPDEVATCTPYLERQLEIIRPSAIVTLGLPSTQYMLQTKLSMGRLRGQFHAWRGIPLMPTYHPAYVLRNPTLETRSAVWSDLKQVLAKLGLPIPKKNV